MSLPNISQMEPWFDDAEASALHAYMKTGGWVTEFRQTEAFEAALAKFVGARHCIATNNGTVALSMALMAVGVGPGDEVIVPDLTMIASPNSAIMIGAKPVLVDVEARTLNIDAERVAAAITPRTKAVMHVSYNGRSNDVVALAEVCRKKGVALIEDSCQSLGSYARNKAHLGTIGAIGCFSFSLPKIISTGQGGALVTNDDDLHRRLRRLKDFGRSGGGNDIHDVIGYNFKFTDLQAVIGLEQMRKLPWRLTRKKEIWRRYRDRMAKVPGVVMLETDLDIVSPWFIDVFVRPRAELQAHLKTLGIGTRIMYPPIHTQQAYADRRHMKFPVTEDFSPRGLWLPSSAQLTDADIDRVCAGVASFFAAAGAAAGTETH